MMLVSPLAHVLQKQPFDDKLRSHIECKPEPSCKPELKLQGPGVTHHHDDIEVFLNIYDVAHDSAIKTFNGVFANSLSPMKFGGVFHVGVEILKSEWAYGWTKFGTGVSSSSPQSSTQHHFRERVSLSKTKLSLEEIEQVLRNLLLEYRGQDYHLIEKNCCHFAEDLCARLGVDPLPGWVHRMGQLCRKVSDSILDLSRFHLSCAPSESEQVAESCGVASRVQSRCSVESARKLCYVSV